MNILVACKVVPDDQDIQVSADGSLDFSKAKPIISAYDVNAIEAASQLAKEAGEASVIALTVGPASIDDSKLKKNILARGADELVFVADDSCESLDSHATAAVLASIAREKGFDLIVCGDGSADEYAQQVDVQLGAQLGIPSVSGVTQVSLQNGAVSAQRTLEDAVEEVRVGLPCVIAVSPDVAQPRIPGMKDILAAGKKPQESHGAGEVPASRIVVDSCKAPEAAARKLEILDASEEGAIEKFAAAIRAAL